MDEAMASRMELEKLLEETQLRLQVRLDCVNK
jgi:hypothetical protein